ncbi:MAG: hypothetical protein ACXW2X_08315 [Thermoanaerobaculia bacterium]
MNCRTPDAAAAFAAHFMDFQFRGFPSASHSMAVSIRFFFVASCFGHAAEDAFVFEVGDAPLHDFLDVCTGIVKCHADLLQDRACERLCVLDVCVDIRREFAHDGGRSSRIAANGMRKT